MYASQDEEIMAQTGEIVVLEEALRIAAEEMLESGVFLLRIAGKVTIEYESWQELRDELKAKARQNIRNMMGADYQRSRDDAD